MVNDPTDIQDAGEAGGGVAILDAQFAARAVAIGVHRGLGHAEFAGDLLGRKMLIDQPQAFALTRCEEAHRIFRNDEACDHSASS